MKNGKKMLAMALSFTMAVSGGVQYGYTYHTVKAASASLLAAEGETAISITTQGSSWTNGYSMNVYLENNTDAAIDDWKIVVDKSLIQISSIWCASLEETEDEYIITPESWNTAISANGSVNFGFCGTGTMPDTMLGNVYYTVDGVEYANGGVAESEEPTASPVDSAIPSDRPSDRPSSRPSDLPTASAQPGTSQNPTITPTASTEASVSPSSTTVTSTPIENITSGSYTTSFSGGASKTLSGAYLIDGVDVTVDGGTYASSASDQAVFLVVNGGSLTISDATIVKTGDASESSKNMPNDVSDDYNFYGLNSAVVVVGSESSATINGTSISTAASGSNAVFATNSGQIEISGSTITTTKDSSRGLDSTYDGSITAENMTITTSGRHCAPLANDRGGGTIDVSGTNVMNASGEGSPVIYSTGSITVDGVTGTAEKSQAIVVEGKNSVSVTNSTLTGKGSNGIMMYQSESGDAADSDAATSVSSLTLKDSTINSTADGPMFYITNASAVINCTNTTLNNQNSSSLITAAAGNWGTSGKNGGKLTFTAKNQKLNGAITTDSISTVSLALTEGSSYAGTTSGDNISITTDSTSSADY